MVETQSAERTITAVFTEESQVDDTVRRLLNRGVDRDRISVMGRNFQSQTRISGFITKKVEVDSQSKTVTIESQASEETFRQLITATGHKIS
jgi:hypothetical protein